MNQSNISSSVSILTPDQKKQQDQFFALWLEQPSWSPIEKKGDRWATMKTASGKLVPLTLKAIKRAYGKAIAGTLGKRFGKLTNYLMVDVDAGSLYHPTREGIEAITAALEKIGLCRFFVVRSSDSGGLHIYFPLPEATRSWKLAAAAQKTLRSSGVAIAPGQCELFPNTKQYDSDYNGHRLPLQTGSYLVDKDLQPLGDSKGTFVHCWRQCAEGQDAQAIALACGTAGSTEQVDDIPAIAWTGPGQSNLIMLKLGRYGLKLGLRGAELAIWIKATVRNLPGFAKWCSRRSKRDIEHGWCKRVAQWALKVGKMGKRKKLRESDYNQSVSDEALSRIRRSLLELGANPDLGIYAAWKAVSAKSKELFGVGISWNTFQKHRIEILDSLYRDSVEPDIPESDGNISPPRMNGVQASESQAQQTIQPSHTPTKFIDSGPPQRAIGTPDQAIASTSQTV